MKFIISSQKILPSVRRKRRNRISIVRRHLLCPHFATRFVSALFFRARGDAAARRDGGLKAGGAVYAVSALGLAAGPAAGSVSAVRFRKLWIGGGSRASAADGAALCQEDYYIRLFDLFAMVPMFHVVFHACHGGHRPGRCVESDE